MKQIEADLCLNSPFVKGQTLPVRNCWHFSTQGESVELLFYDKTDFKDGMNRIYVVSRSFKVVILAFILMDTHVHFVLYGKYDECNSFVHEYLRRTSMYIRLRHDVPKALLYVRVSSQTVDSDRYLKNVICYVCRNVPVAGLSWSFYDYPWSSAPLYFRSSGSWTSPMFLDDRFEKTSRIEELKRILKTKHIPTETGITIIDGMVFPGEYVAVEVTERVFRTHKSFFYFMGHTKEDDIEMRGGDISRLSIPIHEMRQNRDMMCRQLFGTDKTNKLSTSERLKLARALKSAYNSSSTQIARICGLVKSEVEKLL